MSGKIRNILMKYSFLNVVILQCRCITIVIYYRIRDNNNNNVLLLIRLKLFAFLKTFDFKNEQHF